MELPYLIPSEFPFPVFVNLRTEDTSKFQEAHDLLVSLGCIPKSLYDVCRPLEDILANPNLPWEQEQCCVYPFKGKEYLICNSLSTGGIYRVVFRGPTSIEEYENHFKKLKIPIHIDFKYCFRHTPKEYFIENSIPPKDPMKEHVMQVYSLVKPISVCDQIGKPIRFPY